MTNYDRHFLTLFEDDLQTIKEYFTIAINTIFYHRWLGETNYEDTKTQDHDINYIKMNNGRLQKIINENIKILQENLTNYNKAKVNLRFFQEKEKNFLIFTKNSGLWEEWQFIFSIKKNVNKDKESKIRQYIFQIIQKLNGKKDYMPQLIFDVQLPDETFPYEMEVKAISSEEEFLDVLKDVEYNNSFKDIL